MNSYIDTFREITSNSSSNHEEYCYRTIIASISHLESINVNEELEKVRNKSKINL